jgi:hypothetical protein
VNTPHEWRGARPHIGRPIVGRASHVGEGCVSHTRQARVTLLATGPTPVPLGTRWHVQTRHENESREVRRFLWADIAFPWATRQHPAKESGALVQAKNRGGIS